MKHSRDRLNYDKQQKFVARVREIYAESYHFARTHQNHLSEMNRLVWINEEYRKLPAYRRAIVSAIDSVMFNSLYEWRYGNKSPLAAISIGPDGRMFGTENDDTWLAEDSDYKSAMVCSHVWRHKWDAGELKIWS